MSYVVLLNDLIITDKENSPFTAKSIPAMFLLDLIVKFYNFLVLW